MEHASLFYVSWKQVCVYIYTHISIYLSIYLLTEEEVEEEKQNRERGEPNREQIIAREGKTGREEQKRENQNLEGGSLICKNFN